MASPAWRANRPLNTLLFEQYGRFNAHQLVRLLRWRVQGDDDSGDPQIALTRHLRFRADLSAAFPGHEISAVTRVATRKPKRIGRLRGTQLAPELVEIRSPDYCVASISGPMPEPYTEWVREQEKAREHAMADFLDVFNQRVNALRFGAKAEQAIALNHLPPERTRHAQFLASLMGMAHPEMAEQIPLPRRAWLGLAGLLANTRHSAPVLTGVLSLYLDAKVTLTELVGAWQAMEDDDRTRLGTARHALGRETVLGSRVWDQQARIRLDVATMDYTQFHRLLPPFLRTGAAQNGADSRHAAFVALLRLLTGRQADCEVRLRVRTATIPDRALRPTGAPGMQLGQSAWLDRAHRRADDESVRTVSFLVRAFDGTVEAL